MANILNLKIAANVDFTDVAKTTAAFTGIALVTTDDDVKVKLASMSFAFGRARRGSNDPTLPKIGVFIDAFITKSTSGSRTYGKKSKEAIVSAAGGFGILGGLPYDAAPCAEFILSQKPKLGDTAKGAVARRIAAAYPTELPTPEQMVACLPAKEPETATDVVEDLCEDFLAAFGVKGKFLSALTTPEMQLQAGDICAMMLGFKAMFPKNETNAAAEYKARNDALRAKMSG